MKRTFRVGLLLTTAAIAAATAPAAWAFCTGLDAEPVFFGFGGFIADCPDALPVTGYVYGLASPATINSGTQDFVCNQTGVLNGISLPCQGEAGIAGDGIVTLYYEFGTGNPGSVGCPSPDFATLGSGPVMVQVVCNNGAGALIQSGLYSDIQQYLLELSAPGDGSPIMAGFQNGPVVTSVGAGPSPSAATVCVNVPNPAFYSDCDPASAGGGLTCPGGAASRPAVTRGKLYVREAACGSSPNSARSLWTPLATNPDATGAACNSITNPTTPGFCAFVGASGFAGATETGGILGWLQVPGPGAANDKVKIDNAAFAQGKLVVAFSTTNETSIVGFNVYSGATKLNGDLITAKGTGSNGYSFEVGRGALKGGKTIFVEAVKSAGPSEKTAPVTLK